MKEIVSNKLEDISGGNLFFPSYKCTGIQKVLLIRELSPCRYLTSFLLAYEHYLKYDLNKKVKLVFVHQKGAGITSKYSDYISISQESVNVDSLYSQEIIATSHPKQVVMKKIFSSNADIFIVVDRLYGNQDIVTGRVNKLNAVSGMSDLRRYNVKADKCIFPIIKNDDAFISIPTIDGYPDDNDRRHAVYTQVCKEMFDKIDGYLKINK